MHSYKTFKEPFQTLKTRANYAGPKDVRSGMKPFDEFIYYLYYSHAIEDATRPSQVSSEMKQKNITQKDFLKFLKSNEVYQTLTKIKNFSFEQLVNNLSKHESEIKKNFSDANKGQDFSKYTPNEIIELYLDMAYRHIVIQKSNVVFSQLLAGSTPLQILFAQAQGFRDDKKQKILDHLASQFGKYQNNPLMFYKNEIKNMNFVADKMIKKISKLYDMAKKDEMSEEKSIINWDLHHKLVNKSKKFDYNLSDVQEIIKSPKQKKDKKKLK